MAFSSLYRPSMALLTDQYQMTMAYGYWKASLHNREAVFSLFYRNRAFGGGFTVTAGLENVIDFLENFHFDTSDIDYLSSLKGPEGASLFPEPFLRFLSEMKFSCDIDAVPEGTPMFPYEPLLRVTGPMLQCQILETPLLNLINFPTLIATKAARITRAAEGDPVIEFGLRRAQGVDGALTAARAAYIGGCESTSNVLAGKMFGIPIKGTHSHSWVMAFPSELEAFESYAEALPSNCLFLVDTYNTIDGINNAIKVGHRLRQEGKEMLGIRLDSGDLAYLSKIARKMLDEAGFPKASIVASNELDEYIISDMKRQGAKVDIWGIGTNLITAKDQPALDGVYKLSAIQNEMGEWEYKLKLSEQMKKISNPGILQVRRYSDGHENVADMFYDQGHPLPNTTVIVDPLDSTRRKELQPHLQSKDLLVPVFRRGKCVYKKPSLPEIQTYAEQEMAMFHPGIKRFLNPHQYVVGMEKTLYDLKVNLIEKIREETPHLHDNPLP